MSKADKSTLDVEIELVETWPPAFLDAARRNHGLIVQYQRERRRIDHLCQDDIVRRMNPPDNKYRATYDSLVERLDQSITRHRIVGYHCTRLTRSEISGIKANGLRVLSSDLVRLKLDQCIQDGLMSATQRDYLSNSKTASEALGNKHGMRTGMIWFCPNRSTLRIASGVFRLFRSWGGEAIYFGHETDNNIAGDLARLGTPCIVKCAIPFPCDDPYYPKFAARFLSQLVENDIEFPEPPADFDLRTKRDLSASEVLEIIEFSDPQFEELTGCSAWSVQYRIAGAT